VDSIDPVGPILRYEGLQSYLESQMSSLYGKRFKYNLFGMKKFQTLTSL